MTASRWRPHEVGAAQSRSLVVASPSLTAPGPAAPEVLRARRRLLVWVVGLVVVLLRELAGQSAVEVLGLGLLSGGAAVTLIGWLKRQPTSSLTMPLGALQHSSAAQAGR